MHLYDNQPSGTVSRARALRRNATDAEKALWLGLRRAFRELKFRRQVPIGPYFADFLCLSARLVIEVDGGQHDEAKIYDEVRTRFIAARAIA
jgi:very-short-patch-repair endonuclease